MKDEVIKFIGAVISHWQAYATGGVVTGLIAVVERLSGWQMPKKAYAAIFLGAFLFVFFFLAWRDEFERANNLQHTLNQRPSQPQVQVNMPPPTVVIQQQEHPVESNTEPSGFLQLERLQFARDQHTLADNQIVSLNIAYKNPGPYPVTDEQSYAVVMIAERATPDAEQFAKTEHEMRKMFGKWRKQAVQKTAQLHGALPSVGANQIFYTSALSPPLTPAQVSGIANGATRIYALTWAQWKDSHKRVGTSSGCFWMQPPKTSDLLASDPVWHSCDGPM
jgi:hypothetical protein